MGNIPENIKYAKSHEWVDVSDSGKALVGITDYAQQAMGDIVFFGMPEVGDEVIVGEMFADMESVKAVSEIFAPISGTVSAVNEALADEPGLVNQDPYGAWIIEVSPYAPDGELLDASAYAELVTAAEADA